MHQAEVWGGGVGGGHGRSAGASQRKGRGGGGADTDAMACRGSRAERSKYESGEREYDKRGRTIQTERHVPGEGEGRGREGERNRRDAGGNNKKGKETSALLVSCCTGYCAAGLGGLVRQIMCCVHLCCVHLKVAKTPEVWAACGWRWARIDTHTNTHTRTTARTHAHTHTHTRARTHTYTHRKLAAEGIAEVVDLHGLVGLVLEGEVDHFGHRQVVKPHVHPVLQDCVWGLRFRIWGLKEIYTPEKKRPATTKQVVKPHVHPVLQDRVFRV